MNKLESFVDVKRPCKIVPIDIKVLSWLIISLSVLFFIMGTAIFTRVALIPSDDVRIVLFGIWRLDSISEFGIYYLAVGVLGVLAGIFIHRTSIIGFFMLGFLMINGMVNVVLVIPEFPITGTIGMLVNIGVLLWLLCRRDIFCLKKKGSV